MRDVLVCLDGGSLSVGNNAFENSVPYPLDVQGDIRFSAANLFGEWLVINGTRMMVDPVAATIFQRRMNGTPILAWSCKRRSAHMSRPYARGCKIGVGPSQD